MFPPLAVAASLVQSLDDDSNQVFVPPVDVTSVHVAPESTDVQMFPLTVVAASLVPSLDDYVNQVLRAAIRCHLSPRRSRVRGRPDVSSLNGSSLVPSLDERDDLPALTSR